MPLYDFKTEEIVPHEHTVTIELPVDMGDSSIRLTDRMARTVAENRALDGISATEKVVAVYRDGEQIWPRKHKPKTDTRHPDPALSDEKSEERE